MTLNSLSIRGENQAGNTIVSLREGTYLYPDGELLFEHSFPGIVVASLETSPGVWLQLWVGPVNIVATTVYNLRADIFTYTVRRLMSTLGMSRIRVMVQELDMPGGVAINDWESISQIEVLAALPAISTYYTEMTPNYLFDSEEFLINTRIYDMDADSIAILHINDKVFRLDTIDNLNYSTIIPAELVGVFMLKKWEIIAIGPGGTVVYPETAANFKWMGVVDYDRKVVIIEGWTDDDSLDDWDEVGDEIYTSWTPSKILYVYIPCNVLEEQYMSKDIHKMNADKPFEFHANLGMSGSMTVDASVFVGLFGDSDDVTIIKNVFGLRKFVKAGPVHQLAVVVIDYLGNKTEEVFTTTLEDLGDDVLYTVKYVWDPETLTVTAQLYRTDDDDELTLIETITKVLPSLPIVELDKYGVHYDYSASDVWERLYLGSTMLRIGNIDQTIHKVVDDLEVDAGETTDTDYHIVMHYYDFTTGETITADDDLDVDILDSEDATIASLTAVQREDGKYEAFWSTVGIASDTYNVKVTGSLNGRIVVTKQLVSVENE